MEKESPFYVRATYMLLFIVLMGFVLQIGASVLMPLTFAVLFTFIIKPLSIKLESWHLPRWLAATIGIVLLMAAVIGIIGFLSYQTAQIAHDLPTMKAKLGSKGMELQNYIGQRFGFSISQQNNWLDERLQSLASSAGDYLMTAFSATTTLITNLFLVPLLMFFLLLYRDRFKTFILQFDEDTHVDYLAIVRQIGDISQQYLKGLFIEMVIVAALMTVGFWIIGLPYALFLGVLVAIANVVPYIGGILGSLLAILLALVTADGNLAILGALGVCTVVQLLDNNIISVKVVGSSVSLNPLFSTLAFLIGALVWGVGGMLLAMPLTGMLKAIFDRFPHLRPYGYILGEDEDFIHKPLRINMDSLPMLKQLMQRKTKSDNG